jgi:hypothetical protein
MSRRLGVWPLVAAMLTVGTSASAQETSSQQWSIAIWGFSYHFNRNIDYNEHNWGIGIRDSMNGRFFFEADALRNSHNGLIVPVSAGAEFNVTPPFGRCRVQAVAALTVAYYGLPADEGASTVRFGPLPGAAIGCGRFKANTMLVLSPSSQPFVALVTFLTIRLSSH